MLSSGTDGLLAIQHVGACWFCCGIRSQLSISPAGEGLRFAYSVGQWGTADFLEVALSVSTGQLLLGEGIDLGHPGQRVVCLYSSLSHGQADRCVSHSPPTCFVLPEAPSWQSCGRAATALRDGGKHEQRAGGQDISSAGTGMLPSAVHLLLHGHVQFVPWAEARLLHSFRRAGAAARSSPAPC